MAGKFHEVRSMRQASAVHYTSEWQPEFRQVWYRRLSHCAL